LDSFTFDAQIRKRLTGLNISFFLLDETAVIAPATARPLTLLAARLAMPAAIFAPYWLRLRLDRAMPHWTKSWALTRHERTRIRSSLDALVACLQGLDMADLMLLLGYCDLSLIQLRDDSLTRLLNPKGFWRVDRDQAPECRQTVLTLVAFADLMQKVDRCSGNVAAGVKEFCCQNDGEGWMLPETLRLADYGLGHDERAQQHQPVRECFGPRFYDWQLAQTPEESWRECHLHARNLLGPQGYQALLDEIAGKAPPATPPAAATAEKQTDASGQGTLFDIDDLPLFPE